MVVLAWGCARLLVQLGVIFNSSVLAFEVIWRNITLLLPINIYSFWSDKDVSFKFQWNLRGSTHADPPAGFDLIYTVFKMYVPSRLFLSVLSRKQILQNWVEVYVDFKLCCRPKKWEIMKKVRKKAIRGRLCMMQFFWESRCWVFLFSLYIYNSTYKYKFILFYIYLYIINEKAFWIPCKLQLFGEGVLISVWGFLFT